MTNAQIIHRRRHARRIALQRARRAARMASGLRYDGKPLQRRRHHDLSHLHGPARKSAIDIKVREELVASGLTAQGHVRQLRKWPQLSGLDSVARKRAWRRLLTAERRLAGFTGRGKPLKRFRGPVPARTLKQIQWDYLRRSMGISTPEFLTPIERNAA